MSWLTDLAGKAEDFLNKVDQSAAVALKKEELAAAKSAVYAAASQRLEPISTAFTTYPSAPVSAPASPARKANSKVLPPVSPRARKVKTEEDDEKLFEFLNSPESVKPVKERVSKTDLVQNTVNMAYNDANDKDYLDSGKESTTTPANEVESITVVVQQEHDAETSQLSPLELENRLLRNEVSSLNQEMSQATHRAKEAEAEVNRVKKHVEFYNTTASQSDRVIKELQDRESDLLEALSAKDSQLAVLRVRLQEADQGLKLEKARLQKLESDRERILQDQTDSSGLHTQALQSLREKLEETENSVERERSQFKMIQNDYTQRLSKLEEENKHFSINLVDTQKQLSSEKTRSVELAAQVRTSKSTLESLRQELADYKQKAQKILQSKEKLISSLKEAGSANLGDKEFDTTALAAGVELEEVRQERDMLREELLVANGNIEQMRGEMQDLESQLQSELELSQEQQKSLEEQLRSEVKQKDEVQQENSHLNEELQYMKEEVCRQKTMYQSRIQDRDNELEKLRKQLTVKMMNNSQSELESRLHSLTESLIQKQTVLEALSTEKNSLVLQLERLEQQVKENQTYMRRGNATAVSLLEENNAKGKIPAFLMESPFDSRVARKVKRAYNTLDTFSVRLGVFMRRYPIARVMVIIYMFLLHLWVFAVLLTYSPEIHPNEKQIHPARK